MELEYELTLDDYVTFNKYHIRHSPSCRRSYRWNLVVLIALGLLLIVLYGAFFGTPVGTVLSCIIYVPLGWLLWRLSYRVTVARRLQRALREGENRDLAGTHVLVIHDEGITTTGQMGETKLKWAVVEKTVEDKEHVYIYVSAVSALVIPKRAFQDEQHMRAFLDEIARFRTALAADARTPA